MGEKQEEVKKKERFACLRGCPFNTDKRGGKILCLGPSMGNFIDPVIQCPFYNPDRPKNGPENISGGHTFNSPDE